MADDTTIPITTTAAVPETTEARPVTPSRPSRRSRSARTTPAPAATKPAEKKAWEQWAKEKRTPEIDKRRAPPFNHWAAGKRITEAEFDAGVYAAAHCAIR
jgi:hypothetical protein